MTTVVIEATGSTLLEHLRVFEAFTPWEQINRPGPCGVVLVVPTDDHVLGLVVTEVHHLALRRVLRLMSARTSALG